MHQTPPLSTDALTFHLPPVEEATLADGTPLYVVRKSEQDLITVSLYIRAGSAHDTVPGATAFAGELLTRGTKQHSAEHLAETIDALGAAIRVNVDKVSCRISGTAMADNVQELVGLMGECLLTPTFDQHELDGLRDQWIGEELIDQRDAGWLAARALARVSFAGHPYEMPRRGTIPTMRDLTRDAVVEAHQRLLQTDRVVIVAGPLDAATVAPYLDSAFGGLPPMTGRVPIASAHLTEHAGCVAVNQDAVQTSLAISLPCPGYDHPDFPAVQLLTTVLGGYTLARLFTELREVKGYTYGAYAHNVVWEGFASTDISTNVGNDFTKDTVKTIDEIVRGLACTRIDEEELENARQYLLGSFARSNETPQQVAALTWKVFQHGLPSDFFQRLVERIQMYTPEELVMAQERWFNADRWAVGASGRPNLVMEAIEPFASPIEVWNVDTGATA